MCAAFEGYGEAFVGVVLNSALKGQAILWTKSAVLSKEQGGV